MASAAAFRRQVHAFVDWTLSPEAQSRRLAQIARRELDGLVTAGRASKSYRRFVDGREGATEDSVAPAPHGQIVYRFNHLGAVVTFALSFLVNRSPMRSGRYRRSFYIGVSTSGSMVPTAAAPSRGAGGRFAPSPDAPALEGGKFIPIDRFNPDALTADVVQIVIGNTQPYSRKVDVQLVGYEKLSFSVPPGLFDDAVSAIRSRYGSSVEVKRVYTMRFPGQYTLLREQHYRTGKRAGRPMRRLGKRVESPAIVITPLR